jgi:hypothetical protein
VLFHIAGMTDTRRHVQPLAGWGLAFCPGFPWTMTFWSLPLK